MRTIKFRAWDSEGKIFWYSDLEKIFRGYRYALEGRGFCGVPKEIMDQKINISDFELMIDYPDFRGKEIYEGDIIREYCGTNKDAPTENIQTGVVIWHDSFFGMSIFQGNCENKIGSYRTPYYEKEIGIERLRFASAVNWEVIGNIHENNELLRQP